MILVRDSVLARGAQYGRGTIYLAKEKLTKFQVLLKEVRYSSSGPPIGRPLLEAPGGSVAAGAQGDEPDGAIGLLQGGRFGGAWATRARRGASGVGEPAAGRRCSLSARFASSSGRWRRSGVTSATSRLRHRGRCGGSACLVTDE